LSWFQEIAVDIDRGPLLETDQMKYGPNFNSVNAITIDIIPDQSANHA
jgi:hypothetical protein